MWLQWHHCVATVATMAILGYGLDEIEALNLEDLRSNNRAQHSQNIFSQPNYVHFIDVSVSKEHQQHTHTHHTQQ